MTTDEAFLDPKFRQFVEQKCNLFPYVAWDRFVIWREEEGGGITVAGWIDRPDKYKDYLLLEIYKNGDITYFTSSAKYSLDVFKKLNDGDGRGHANCKRVEDFFKVENCIKLKTV